METSTSSVISASGVSVLWLNALRTMPYADGKITISATSSLAPRGYYRLFAINANGAISTAKWTRLR